MKLYYLVCMDNNRKMVLYFLCVWKITVKWSCITLGVWEKMMLYPPGCKENNKHMKLCSLRCKENNKQMKLYSPGCMENNRQMKMHSPGCMDNNRQMKLYYPVCMENNKQSGCILKGVWKTTNKWSCVPLGVSTIASLNSVRHEILSSFIIDSYDKVRGRNKAQWWLLSVH
jgi:hypothetical protein